MKKNILLLISSLILISCSMNNSENLSPSENTSQISTEITIEEQKNQFFLNEPDFSSPKRQTKEDVTFDDFFNLSNTVNIKIYISDNELQALEDAYNSFPKSDIYRVADKVVISLKNYDNNFEWEFKNVGIRQKGNTSRKHILINNKINNQNHFKLSFDETFDDETLYSKEFIQEMKTKIGDEDYSEREFLGLSGLDFKWNKNNDSTHIKEAYASKLYQAGGIISQHIGLSTISMINNNEETSFGLCNIYEPASKSLIKRNLKNGKEYVNMSSWSIEKKGTFGPASENYGDYYKCSYGKNDGSYSNGADMSMNSINEKRIGVANSTGTYIPVYEKKTNKKSNDDLLKNCIATINNNDYNEISKVVDLTYLAKCEALSYIVGNPDDMRLNYNNYYMYFRRTDGKLIIIPYDIDRCFGITKDFNFKNGVTELQPLSKDTNSGSQRNNLLLKTILSSSTNQCQKDYLEMINIIQTSSWIKEETFNQFYNQAKNSYKNIDFKQENENMSFETYISKKLNITPSIDNKEYDNLYIVGNFNNWGNYSEKDLPLYKFNKIEKYTYQVTININNSLSNDTLEFKINSGYSNYSIIDWSLDETLTTLIPKKSNNAKLQNVKKGDKIQITINTSTLKTQVEKIF